MLFRLPLTPSTNYGLIRKLLPVTIVQLCVIRTGAKDVEFSVSDLARITPRVGKLKCRRHLVVQLMFTVCTVCITIMPPDRFSFRCK